MSVSRAESDRARERAYAAASGRRLMEYQRELALRQREEEERRDRRRRYDKAAGE